jgi:hypothetical protein
MTERVCGMQRRASLTVVGISHSGGLYLLNLDDLLALRLLLLPNVHDDVRNALRGDLEAHMGFQLKPLSVGMRGEILVLN